MLSSEFVGGGLRAAMVKDTPPIVKWTWGKGKGAAKKKPAKKAAPKKAKKAAKKRAKRA